MNNREKSSIERLQNVADGLSDLNEKVVYVGGAACGLYDTDTAAHDASPTMYVDCVDELFSYNEYNEFNEELYKRHFRNDIEQGAPICRWIYKDNIVDIMPDDEEILGFSNRWYRPGFKSREPYTLPSGKTIYILPVTYYVATKLDAILSRGGHDLRTSHDFEDLIYVLNYCPEFVERYHNEEETLRTFLHKEFAALLQRQNIQEEIECALPLGEEERVDMIIRILQS
ncbi:MAG: hypothetical protein MJZ89_06145 [Paludibacteraceae bacterium]|nr:hypothetical protein [Paludibacteraceae bacterium]